MSRQKTWVEMEWDNLCRFCIDPVASLEERPEVMAFAAAYPSPRHCEVLWPGTVPARNAERLANIARPMVARIAAEEALR